MHVVDDATASEMHSLLRHGFPLTVEQQRYLWNCVAACVFNPNIIKAGVIQTPRKRCQVCNGTGDDPRITNPLCNTACEACDGVGYVDPPAP
jgi:hypothetical protein